MELLNTAAALWRAGPVQLSRHAVTIVVGCSYSRAATLSLISGSLVVRTRYAGAGKLIAGLTVAVLTAGGGSTPHSLMDSLHYCPQTRCRHNDPLRPGTAGARVGLAPQPNSYIHRTTIREAGYKAWTNVK